ncbi:MAG: presenilin family intramembrane aspartyl protease [Candidatus Micrarchaeota archaeon]
MGLAEKLLVVFIAAQLLGFFTGFVLVKDSNDNPYAQSFFVDQDTSDVSTPFYFFIYIIFSSFLLLMLVRLFPNKGLMFKLLEFLIIASASSIVFYSFLRFAFSYEESMLGGIALGLVLAFMKFNSLPVKNLVAIISTAGVGVVFGLSFQIIPIFIFIVLLAIYDYIAVFKTKHMVELAEFVMKQDLAFTITVRQKPKAEGERERLDLGTGDLIVPIATEMSAFAFNPISALFVFAGATISLYAFIYIASRKKMILPALPPIVFGMAIFFAIGKLIGFY